MTARVASVFVGKRGSGKTSYLAALWSTLKNAEDDDLPRLTGDWPANTQFLDDIEQALLTGQEVERTRTDTGEEVRLSIKLDEQSETQVSYLDVAGESIASVLINRRAPDKLMEALAEATATILFLHPENDTKQMPMLDHGALAVEHEDSPEDGGAEATTSTEESEDLPASRSGNLAADDEVSDETIWKAAPSAAHLVELLQVCQETGSTERRPVVVIVSAWDLVQAEAEWGSKPTPAHWLHVQLPLLAQYLEANQARHPWKVFGVSAQGADSRNEEAMKLLLPKKCADRTVVVSDGEWTRDICTPLRWLVEVSS